MILEHEQWSFGYDQILQDCRPDGNGSAARTALILCNADVDAMASARILSYMLRSDGIHYQLLPCTSYTELEDRLEGMSGAGVLDEVSSIVLLNFGASRNLTKLFAAGWLEAGACKVYVMDCRRPIHLANVYAPDHVVVFFDTTQGLAKDLPSDGDNLSGDESSSDDSDSSSEDGDSDDEDSDREDEQSEDEDEDEEEANFDDVVGETKEIVSAAAATGDDPEYDAEDETEEKDEEEDARGNEDDAGGNDSFSREAKRQKTGENDEDGGKPGETTQETAALSQATTQSVSPRELHAQRRNRLRKYYSEGSFYGSPCSFVAYALAAGERYREQGDLLWLACVGVTDAYLHSRLDRIGYAKLAQQLGDTCTKLYPNTRFDRALSAVYAEDLVGHAGHHQRYADQTKTKIALSETGRIFSEKDFRFFLLRHSSLLDSMQYSDYVCSKLQLYTKPGEQKLLELLAKMGYPLDECKQPFPFMRPTLRRRLKEKLQTHAPEYNLDRFEFTSFTRVTGYSSLLSASDTSYAVTALLEYEPPKSSKDEAEWNASDASERDRLARIEAFHNAYDALGSHSATNEPLGGSFRSGSAATREGYDSTNLVNGGNLSSTTGLGAGLKRAMALQKTLLHTAIGLVERSAITLLRHFRYAHVTPSNANGAASGGHILQTTDLIARGSSSNASGGGGNKQNHVFSKPLALSRLAQFLMELHRENGKWAGTKARPLVLIADRPRTDTCLVVGYEPSAAAGAFVKNAFGKHFEMTAKSMNGTFKFDGFDSNAVEVASGDVQRFLEQLHYLLDSI